MSVRLVVQNYGFVKMHTVCFLVSLSISTVLLGGFWKCCAVCNSSRQVFVVLVF